MKNKNFENLTKEEKKSKVRKENRIALIILFIALMLFFYYQGSKRNHHLNDIFVTSVVSQVMIMEYKLDAGIPHSSDDDSQVRRALGEYNRSFIHSRKARDIYSAVRDMSIYLEEYSSLSEESKSQKKEALRKYDKSKLYLMNLLELQRKKYESFDVLWDEGVFSDLEQINNGH